MVEDTPECSVKEVKLKISCLRALEMMVTIPDMFLRTCLEGDGESTVKGERTAKGRGLTTLAVA